MTERSESERAELVALADELEMCLRRMDKPGFVLTKRAVAALRRLAGQDQKPVADNMPDHGGADAGVIDARWRTELDEIVSHLGAAITQSVASDDQIIMDHVKAAHEIAKVVRRQA